MPLSRDQATTILSRYQNDPAYFARIILGHDPWSTPLRIMEAIAQPRARVAVKACHGSSKTFTAAEIVLWWTLTGGVSITTAPTYFQVERLLWGEIRDAYQRARFPLGGKLLQTELKISPTCYAVGLATNEGVNFQGAHGRVLIVLDEAPGVRPDIWEAISGIRAGGDVRLLALGNPTISSGPFYDAFTSQRAGWHTFTIDAFDTPNFTQLGITSAEDLLSRSDDDLAHVPRPYLVTPAWAKDILQEQGDTSPIWQARVRGQFPDQSEDALISLSWLEQARYRELAAEGELWAGLDVAGPGEDETSLTVMCGPVVLPGFPLSWPHADPRGEVIAALATYKAQRIQVNVDSIGIGYYMARHIQDAGFTVHNINVADAPRDKEKYANAKAEHYWGLRQCFQQGDMAGLTDEKTISQLSGIRYKHNSRGQIQIESKEDARKRGVKSPDRAESVMLARARTRVGLRVAPTGTTRASIWR